MENTGGVVHRIKYVYKNDLVHDSVPILLIFISDNL